MAAIKAGNSVWRANAAHELGYLNPAIHRQIYTAGMNLPRTFGFNDPYVGNWFFRAPVFTKNGMFPRPTSTAPNPGTQLALPAYTPATLYNGTYKAPYTVRVQGDLEGYRPVITPKASNLPTVVDNVVRIPDSQVKIMP